MDSQTLRDLQAPLKAKYRETPDAAVITLKAEGEVDALGIACRVDTGKALVEAGLHPLAGGTGLQACSGDMLLEALAACAGVTLKAVATALNIKLDGARVHVEGDFDARGTLGVDKTASVGLRDLRLRFSFDTDASAEQVQKLLDLTERYCVVYQTIRNATPVTVSRG